MMSDPQVDWQNLTDTYSKMWDEELLGLAADSGDLTEVAREVLRNEMRKRGLEDPRAANGASRERIRPAVARGWEPGADLEGEAPHGGGSDEESALQHEYTWKTPLCECDDRTGAWQLCEALRRAGIDSWIERHGFSSELGGPVVTVAADQLEAARAIAAQPIPQEIVELSKAEVPEFEAPVCPRCGAEDPTLEDVEPVNSWLCEACGAQWSESAEDVKLEDSGR
jgi:hypothetical protein